MTRKSNILWVVLALAATTTIVRADDTESPPVTTKPDVRDRTIGHVVTAPTAWMPEGVGLTSGIDHHGGTRYGIDIPFGGFAGLDVTGDKDVKASEPVFLWRATFRVGTRQDRWFRGQPALALGVRRSFREDRYEEADAFVVASRDLGPVRLHAGASIGDMEEKDTPTANRKSFRQELRSVKPLGGFEWTPAQYPKTTLMGDLAYVPTLTEPKFLTAIAVRYQAFDWGSVELGMRYRESEEIGESAFFVRANVR